MPLASLKQWETPVLLMSVLHSLWSATLRRRRRPSTRWRKTDMKIIVIVIVYMMKIIVIVIVYMKMLYMNMSMEKLPQHGSPKRLNEKWQISSMVPPLCTAALPPHAPR